MRQRITIAAATLAWAGLTLAVTAGMMAGLAAAAEPEPAPAPAEPTIDHLLGDLEKCEASTCSAMRTLVARGEAVWPALQAGLDSPLEMTRFWTIGVLAELRVASARPALIALLARDPLVRIRAASAFALGNIGGPETAEPLTAALRDPDVNVRYEAASALVRSPAKLAVPELVRLLRDPDDDVKTVAMEALAATRDPAAIRPITARLEYPQARVRGYAAIALGMFKAKEAVAALAERTRKERDADALSAALWALGEIGGPGALEAVREHVDHDHEKVRAHAIDAMQKLAPAPVRPPAEP